VRTVRQRDRETAVDRVLVLFGGRSSEHEISCLSARSVLAAIDRSAHEVLAVGIARDGRWTVGERTVASADRDGLPAVDPDLPAGALVPVEGGAELVTFAADGSVATRSGRIDVAFPVLHGIGGEDGSIQGLLETFGVPHVGADVAASSVGMHKGAMKAAFAREAIPQTPHLVVPASRWRTEPAAVRAEVRALEGPWFVKPARQGSSIGIGRVEVGPQDEVDAALDAAMAEALAHDDVVVIESAVESARELEVGVLERDGVVEVTAPGEIVSARVFYDFAAKYLADSQLIVPADVDTATVEAATGLARRAFAAIGCRGMARVDLFLAPDGRLLINEINTIPGFTQRSMFPRLWEAAGIDYPALVDRLLAAAR
jgi:D-alanine-D-alanine ligase